MLSVARARRVRSAPALLLALVASGCLAESHMPGDPEGPIALDGFCDAFVAALCEPLASCGCSETAVADCRRERAVLCVGFPSPALASAVESGRIRYDGTRGRDLVSRMRERALDCEDFVAALEWRVGDLLSLGGVFNGQLAPGEPCTSLGFELISECGGGTCAPIEGELTCIGAVAAGAPCDRLHYCADLSGPLTAERGIERLTLRCVEEDGGRCARWADAGELCDTDGDCWTSRCIEGTCASLEDGAACFSSRECRSAHCAGGGCAPGGRAAGEPCESPSACLSYSCVAGRCEPSGCGTF